MEREPIETEIEGEYRAQVAATLRARLPYVVGSFLATLAATALVGPSRSPERLPLFVALCVYTLLIGAAAIAHVRLAPRRSVWSATAFNVGVLVGGTVYYLIQPGQLELFALAVLFVMAAHFLLLPVGGISQSLVATTSIVGTAILIIAGVPAIVPPGNVMVGAIFLGGFTVVAALQLDRYRFNLFRAEQVLRHREGRFRSLVQHSTDVTLVVDANAKVVWISPSIEQVSGYTDEEVVGNSIIEYAHPDDIGKIMESFGQLLTQPGRSMLVEFRARRKDGDWIHLETFGINLFDDPYVRGVVAHSRDITARKRAEEAQHREAEVSAAMAKVGQELMAAASQPLVLDRLCQLTAELLECAASATFMFEPESEDSEREVIVPVAQFGSTPEQWESIRPIRLDRAARSAVIGALENYSVTQVDHTDAAELDSVRALCALYDTRRTLYMPLRRGPRLIGYHTASKRGDSTPFTETQERIGRGVAHLGSLALENARLVEQLERANLLKSEFVATMSHELRTPLAVVIGYVDLLLEGTFGALSAEQAETLERTNGSARELLDLINAILDLSRLESGRLPVDLHEVRIDELVAEIERETVEVRDKPGVRFEANLDASARALHTDPAKLKVILKNLIGNAMKFTDRGRVALDVIEDGGDIEFVVSDTGIGMSAEVQTIVFEPFRQADSAVSATYGGVGLGLYIVRRLAEALGGSVDVTSAPQQGSVFRVRLPRAQP